jgi:hypothetical protein
LIYLHNYFIIHDIKYFILNKINQTIQGGKKISGGTNYRKYYRKALFFKIQGDRSWTSVHPPLLIYKKIKKNDLNTTINAFFNLQSEIFSGLAYA